MDGNLEISLGDTTIQRHNFTFRKKNREKQTTKQFEEEDDDDDELQQRERFQ